MLDEPRTRDYILPSVLAILFGLPTWLTWREPFNSWMTAGLVLTVLFAFSAVVEFIWLMMVRWSDLYRDMRQASAITKESHLAESMRTLAPQVQEFLLDRFKLSIERHLTPQGKVIDKLGPTGVPMDWFVGTFLRLCNGDQLCPIGTWNENTVNRAWCKAVTDYLVDLGLAITNGDRNGPKPARFAPGMNPFILLHTLGYSMDLNVQESEDAWQ